LGEVAESRMRGFLKKKFSITLKKELSVKIYLSDIEFILSGNLT